MTLKEPEVSLHGKDGGAVELPKVSIELIGSKLGSSLSTGIVIFCSWNYKDRTGNIYED